MKPGGKGGSGGGCRISNVSSDEAGAGGFEGGGGVRAGLGRLGGCGFVDGDAAAAAGSMPFVSFFCGGAIASGSMLNGSVEAAFLDLSAMAI